MKNVCTTEELKEILASLIDRVDNGLVEDTNVAIEEIIQRLG
ncbi:hypothetical protein [Halobacillus salinarum]|nr:hypothetical protein [Halobacillus salinarum]